MEALETLLSTAWPSIGQTIRQVAACGVAWNAASQPFIHYDGDIPVAHVGVLNLPVRMLGQDTEIAGIHAACTHPAYQRRGYFKALMRQALQHCDAHFATCILYTDQPELYTPFGFRTVAFDVFDVAVPSRHASALPRITMADAAMMIELLEHRQAVSDTFALRRSPGVFLFDELFGRTEFKRIYALKALDCVVAYEVLEDTLHLYDVLTKRDIPKLAELLLYLPGLFTRVRLHMSPDKLLTGEKIIVTTTDFVMARGPLAIETQRFGISPLSQC